MIVKVAPAHVIQGTHSLPELTLQNDLSLVE